MHALGIGTRDVKKVVLLLTPDLAGTTHLRLELQIDRMSDDERRAAANKLRHALGLLEEDG